MSDVGSSEDTVPTRAEIQSQLDKVPRQPTAGLVNAKQRNTRRRDNVRNLLAERGVPARLQNKIMSDIASYPGWEPEDQVPGRREI